MLSLSSKSIVGFVIKSKGRPVTFQTVMACGQMKKMYHSKLKGRMIRALCYLKSTITLKLTAV